MPRAALLAAKNSMALADDRLRWLQCPSCSLGTDVAWQVHLAHKQRAGEGTALARQGGVHGAKDYTIEGRLWPAQDERGRDEEGALADSRAERALKKKIRSALRADSKREVKGEKRSTAVIRM